jgi:cytidylate kinase
MESSQKPERRATISEPRATGFLVAIDGTAGSGKSTTAKLAARQLGFFHLDTGAMYRAVTLKVLRAKIGPTDVPALQSMLAHTRVELVPDAGKMQEGRRKDAESAAANLGVSASPRLRVLLDGEDVTRAIRSPEVDGLVSQVSAVHEVRAHLVGEQRRIAHGRQVICEGRDTTSVVFPNADIKFYLDADMRARATRRGGELRQEGMDLSGKSIADNLTERDFIDSTRACSPLTRVPDAIYIDTTNLTIDEEVMIVVNLVRMRQERSSGSKARPLTP